MADDVRSPAGHAAYSMKGTDDRWVLIQVNTFTNWVNEQLRQVDMSVDNLVEDLVDGVKLCALLEVIQERRIGRVIKAPLNQHQYLENCNLALRAAKNDGIKLVNIGSEDIVNGNLKLTLALIWHLILRYQIGRSKLPAKKLMLYWLNAVLPDMDITNFNKNWNDGLALHALIEYCKPGTCPNWKHLDRRDGLANCRAAMQLARQHFGIPLVLSPENLSSADLDELSGMTYLSYFMKVGSPGYAATLGWVRGQIPGGDVTNFQTAWNDGEALAALTESLGGRVAGWPGDRGDAPALLQKGIAAAKAVGVNPVLTAKEIADPEVDHLGIMAYAARFQHIAPRKTSPRTPPVVMAAPPLVKAAPPSPVPPPAAPVTPPGEMLGVLVHRAEAHISKPAQFQLEALDEALVRGEVRAEVVAPSGSTLPVTVRWEGDRAHCSFTPREAGRHKLYAFNQSVPVKGSPKHVDVRFDPRSIKIASAVDDLKCLVGKATPLRINAKDAARGAVKVEARAPSGRMHDLSVSDTNGVFTTNFTPTEVGDWQISIKYETEHIQGSPFNVRVYDAAQVKVFGLQGGTVGKTFSFTVDSSNAGAGDLTVNISHNGRQIPTQISQEPGSPAQHKISFTPDGSGIYTIRVYFAGMEVNGSPYTLEIVDSSQVTASGEGLSKVELNRRAVFVVNTGQVGSSGDIRVEVTGPRGSKIPSNVLNNGNGTFSVEYTPSEVGEYIVDVYFYGRPIKGSPFKVQSFDFSSIQVRNLRSNAMVGKPCEFDIDAGRAGSGNLEIMVNEGTIPCSVQNRGNRQFHASFVPKEGIPHYVQMRFNGHEVPGSPWKVDCVTTANVSATGAGLQNVACGKASQFEVHTGSQSFEGELHCTVTAPSRRTIGSHIASMGGGVYSVEYTPTEVGNHYIDVMFDTTPINGSPFMSKAYDCSAIQISPIPTGVVSKPVEFTVDVTQAGEGQLEIMVNRGSVPNSVRMLRKGVFLVNFVPRESRPHSVDIRFNGELIQGCPVQVPIMDASRVTVQGEGLKQVAVNKQSYFSVNTGSAGEADLSVRVTAPRGASVPVNTVGSGARGYDIDFRPTETGTHQVDIEYGGVPVRGSPFQVKVYDPARVHVRNMQDGIVGKRASFLVDIDESGEGNMEISVSAPSGGNVQNQVQQLGAGQFEVGYTPQDRGRHRVTVTFNKEHVPGSPFSVNITDASRVTAVGEGLGLVPCGRHTSFTVTAPGARAQDLDVRIIGPDGREQAKPRITETGADTFSVQYTPVQSGEHRVEVQCYGQTIKDSPFTSKAFDASKVIVTNIRPGRVGKPSYFNVDASRAGAGNLEIMVSAGGDNVPNFVKAEGHSHFEVSYTPQTAETHSISVRFNGDQVPGSPYLCEMADSGRVNRLGDVLIRVPLGKPATVTIDPRKAGALSEAVTAEVVTPSDRVMRARVVPLADKGLLQAEFVPKEIGPHCIQVMIGTIEIPGSPFACEVYDVRGVVVRKISKGTIGKPCDFEVDVSQAGAGELEVQVRCQHVKVPAKLIEKLPGVHKVVFVPKLPYRHLAMVAYSKEPVPGSPYQIEVEDTTRVAVIGRSLEATSLNQKAKFRIDPTGALFKSDARLKITGPSPDKRNVRYLMKGAYPGGWEVEWAPRELGVHTVDITYGNLSVVGSPYRCKVYDLSKVKIIRDQHTKGVLGDDVVFFVDASEAGAGNLEVVIKGTRDGTRIPNYIEAVEGKSGKFRVFFTPRPDLYNYQVDVAFNEENVGGSPFNHSIIDASRVSAHGEGLQRGTVGHAARFDVVTQGVSADAPMDVEVTAPSGRRIPAHVVGTYQTNYQVDYTPADTGPHKILVRYADVDVHGSPFTAQITDPGQVRISPIPDGIVGKPITFEIDASQAGEGDLTVDVQGQTSNPIPVITPKSGGRYEVCFTPLERVPHHVTVTFNGQKVPGCPHRVNVFDYNNIYINWEAVNFVPVNKVATIDINTNGAPEAAITARVTDPHGKEIPTQLACSGALYQVSFTPVVIGEHSATLWYGGETLPGSPCPVNAFDSARVRFLDQTHPGRVGRDMGVTVNTCEAGAGTLEFDVRTPSGQPVPFNRRLVADGVERVSFVPTMVADYALIVRLNGHRTSDQPLTLSVLADPSTVSCNWDELRLVQIGRLVTVALDNLPDNRESHLHTSIIDPHGESVAPQTERVRDGYTLTFTPARVGPHVMTARYGGVELPGSPATLEAYDVSLVRVTEFCERVMVRQDCGFVVDTKDAGQGQVEVAVVSSRGQQLVVTSRPVDDMSRHYAFSPQETGDHKVKVTMNGTSVFTDGCLALRVHDAAGVTVTWDAARGCRLGEVCEVTMDTADLPPAQVHVDVTGPDGQMVPVRIQRQDDHTFLLSYRPPLLGRHLVSAAYSGLAVPGSPMTCEVYDVRNIHLYGMQHLGALGQEVSFSVDTSEAGVGGLEVECVTAEGASLQVVPRPLEGRCYEFTFVPTSACDHCVSMTFNGRTVPDTPFSLGVLDLNEVKINWDSGSSATVGMPTTLNVNTHHAVEAELVVKVTDPSDNPVSEAIEFHGRGIYSVTFMPEVIGCHDIAVQYGGYPVPSSPVTCDVVDVTRVVVMEVTDPGFVGLETGFTVSTVEAGEGEVVVAMASARGPVRLHPQPLDNRHTRFVFTPETAGDHSVRVSFGGHPLPDMPLTLVVLDTSALRVDWETTRLTPVSTATSLTMVTGGIPQAQVTPTFTDPRGYELPVQVVQTSDGYTLTFRPSSVGTHQMALLYSGQSVPGSPAQIEVYDVTKVQLQEVTTTGLVGQEMGFTVDATEAGRGAVDVVVRAPPDGSHEKLSRVRIDKFTSRFTFVPETVGEYVIDAEMNGFQVPAVPCRVEVVDASDVAVEWSAVKLGQVNKPLTLTIDPMNAPDALVEVKVTDPEGYSVPPQLLRRGRQHLVTFVPRRVGTHQVAAQYGGHVTSGSPQTCAVYDPSLVRVTDIPTPAILGKDVTFTVDHREACGPSVTAGVRVQVTCGGRPMILREEGMGPGVTMVTFTPMTAVQHHVLVWLHEDRVPGMPLLVDVLDVAMVTVTWESVSRAAVGRPARFVLDRNGAPAAELTPSVTAPDGTPLPVEVSQYQSQLHLVFTPDAVGTHQVSLQYGGQPVGGGAHPCAVYDPAKVRLTDTTQPGLLGQEMGFIVDTSEAGEGEVLAEVTCQGRGVTSKLLPLEGGRVRCSFVPGQTWEHTANVSFNGHRIPGSPLNLRVVDSSALGVNWEGASLVKVGATATILINSKGAPNAKLKISITDPAGGPVETRIDRRGTDEIAIEFVPGMVGAHRVDLEYGGHQVAGCPARCDVYDPRSVTVEGLGAAALTHRETTFTVNTSEAGPGEVKVTITVNGSPVDVRHRSLGNSRSQYVFVPMETADHLVNITFNGSPISDSPLTVGILDTSVVHVDWAAYRLTPVRHPVSLTLDPHGAVRAGVRFRATDPQGYSLQAAASPTRGGHTLAFTPLIVGPHHVEAFYGEEAVPGSPATIEVYDVTKVKVTDVTQPGVLGREVGFSVDSHDAGQGQVKVSVACGAKLVKVTEVTDYLHVTQRFTFEPHTAADHIISVTYNGEQLPDMPITVRMLDLDKLNVVMEKATLVQAQEVAMVMLQTNGTPEADVEAKVTDPKGYTVPVLIEKQDVDYEIQFTPRLVGTHQVELLYGGHVAPPGVFRCEVYDVSKVKVTDITEQTMLGEDMSFKVDPRSAGRGEVRVAVLCGGQEVATREVPHDVRTQFAFLPQAAAPHIVEVFFNNRLVPGCPLTLPVYDGSAVHVDWTGVDSVAVSQPSTVRVDPGLTPVAALTASVTDPAGERIPVQVTESGGCHDVSFLPRTVGSHLIQIEYGGHNVRGSPATCHVYDVSKVKVDDVTNPATAGQTASFTVDTGDAGPGAVKVMVTCQGHRVVTNSDVVSPGITRYTFVPIATADCVVDVRFCEQRVPGVPRTVTVLPPPPDTTPAPSQVAHERLQTSSVTSRSRASSVASLGSVSSTPSAHMAMDRRRTHATPAVHYVPVHKPVIFDVNPKAAANQDVTAEIYDHHNVEVYHSVRGGGGSPWQVEFTPRGVGEHRVYLRCGGRPVRGAPFVCQVFDVTMVTMDDVTEWAFCNSTMGFTVNTAAAGQGTVTVGLQRNGIPMDCQEVALSPSQTRFTFLADIPADYIAEIKFNKHVIKSSPLVMSAYDPTAIKVNTEAVKLVPVQRPVAVEIDPRGMPHSGVEARITDPFGQEVQKQVGTSGGLVVVEFVPLHAGQYTLDLRMAGVAIGNSPLYCQAYDVSMVKVTDVTEHGPVGTELGFMVDTLEAGQGDLEVDVTLGGQPVGLRHVRLDEHHHRFTFQPRSPGNHTAMVTFNLATVPHTPFQLVAVDPSERLAVREDRLQAHLRVNTLGYHTVTASGLRLNQRDATVRFTAPNGELVPAKMVQQPDGDYKVEYSSKYTGRHTVEILYAGQAIMGSPFYVEIYDPNKIRIEGTRNGLVNSLMEFDIIRHEAGRAELGLTITSPSGRSVQYEVSPIPQGDRVAYTPTEMGAHNIYVTYGGLDVPGTPIRQEILDAGSATAQGEGLHKAVEDRAASFVVDSHGRKGNVDVQVDGPNSIAKVNIEPDLSGRYIVTYVPVEVGVYNVYVRWNGRDIDGSPFHPKVANLDRIQMVGGYDSHMGTGGRMVLRVGEKKTLEFDATNSGPGMMTGTVGSPSGQFPCEVTQQDGRFRVGFTPLVEGDYSLQVYYNDVILPQMPMYGRATAMPLPTSINHEKVVLTGHGLMEAKVRQEAEFVIDGAEAGPGIPQVALTGVKANIDVRTSPLGPNKYRCTYVPQVPGAYLLDIKWSDRQVRGAPFKVNVGTSSDASKVQASGEGLRGGIMGKEIRATIDTRRAGPGELTAHCMGPSKVAYCELFDHRDGTFTLNMRPQESGKHILQVKYGGEHIPGSPFMLRVAGAPDASKVRVSGPGVEHGILANYQSHFIVETRGAGAGQLTVRIRGPKGAFRVEMQRESQKDRTILCRYDPAEVGDYIISVKWSDEHVPGSPFRVQIYDTHEEISRHHGDRRRPGRFPDSQNGDM